MAEFAFGRLVQGEPTAPLNRLNGVYNRIHQLSVEVANQIAAGEVIERPSNAVKELVENALDAGARRITIEIEEGGKKLIRVRDDGHGMSTCDAVLSLQRHATSKISGADDLWRVQTLGFRGEALPSLAAVSRLEITTREEDAEIGTQLVVEAGTVLDVTEVGCAPGTEIVVRSLFFNTPVRFRFLKSDAAEAGRISEMVGHLALAYPAVSFLLRHNGKEMLRVEGGGDGLSTLVAVLGKETARQMLPITASGEFEGFEVSGFVGRPQLTRANRNGQLFFVNGRYIKSQSLQHAFASAYKDLIHGRDRHPQGVLFLKVAPGAVDVNVHPTKSEVRFVREGEAHLVLRNAVRDTLVGAQLAPSWDLAPADSKASNPSGTASPSSESRDAGGEPSSNSGPFSYPERANGSSTFAPGPSSSPSGSGSSTPNYSAFSRPPSSQSEISQPLTPTPTAEDRQRFSQRLQDIRNGNQPKFQPQPTEPQFQPAFEPKPKLKLRPIAQITDNSYMVCETEDGLYIVNQHRAHERILADNTIAAAKLKPVESQRLIVPLSVEVGARAVAAVEEHGHLLFELGFEVEAFGGSTLLVRALPSLVAQWDYERAFVDLLDELVGGHAGSGLEERRDALLTMLACKNAIKAGDTLPMAAMQRLVDDLVQVENPSICPHGQPILFKIGAFDLQKRFGDE